MWNSGVASRIAEVLLNVTSEELRMHPLQNRTAFFLVISLAMLTAVAVGFGPTFHVRSAFGTIDPVTRSASLPTHLVVHGAFLTLWFSLVVLV